MFTTLVNSLELDDEFHEDTQPASPTGYEAEIPEVTEQREEHKARREKTNIQPPPTVPMPIPIPKRLCYSDEKQLPPLHPPATSATLPRSKSGYFTLFQSYGASVNNSFLTKQLVYQPTVWPHHYDSFTADSSNSTTRQPGLHRLIPGRQ